MPLINIHINIYSYRFESRLLLIPVFHEYFHIWYPLRPLNLSGANDRSFMREEKGKLVAKIIIPHDPKIMKR